CAGTSRPQRRFHHHDLHPRAQSPWHRRSQPLGFPIVDEEATPPSGIRLTLVYLILVRPMSPQASFIVRKAVILALTLLCGFVFPVTLYFDGYYYRHAPRHPDPTTGHVYLSSVKTLHDVAQVYLTRTETLSQELLFPVIMVCALCAFLLNRRWKIYPTTREA